MLNWPIVTQKQKMRNRAIIKYYQPLHWKCAAVFFCWLKRTELLFKSIDIAGKSNKLESNETWCPLKRLFFVCNFIFLWWQVKIVSWCWRKTWTLIVVQLTWRKKRPEVSHSKRRHHKQLLVTNICRHQFIHTLLNCVPSKIPKWLVNQKKKKRETLEACQKNSITVHVVKKVALTKLLAPHAFFYKIIALRSI